MDSLYEKQMNKLGMRLRDSGTMTYDNDHDHFYKRRKLHFNIKQSWSMVIVIVNGHSQKSPAVSQSRSQDIVV